MLLKTVPVRALAEKQIYPNRIATALESIYRDRDMLSQISQVIVFQRSCIENIFVDQDSALAKKEEQIIILGLGYFLLFGFGCARGCHSETN